MVRFSIWSTWVKRLLVALLLACTHFGAWQFGNSEAERLGGVGYIKGEADTLMKIWDVCENTHKLMISKFPYYCSPASITDTTPQTEPQS